MADWFVSDQDRKSGPFSTEDLAAKVAAGEIGGQALVWKQGLPEWQPVSTHFACAPVPEVVPAEVPREQGPILRYWRGEYPLAVSFWIVGVIGLALMLFTLSVYSIVVSQRGFTPYIALVLVAPVWIVSGIFALFHLVGTWRSAARYLEERKNRPGPGILVWTAQTVAVGGVVAFGVLFAMLGLPSMQESLGIAFWNDPDVPAYSLRMIGETDLEIAGGLKYGVARDFEALLAGNSRVKVIHLNSPGGRVGEAKKLAAIVRARGLTTYTATECASACTVVFAAGRERWMRKGAVLGYHAASFGGSDSPATMRDALIEQGVQKDFAARASLTESGSIWYPKLHELLSGGVVSGEVDTYKFPASGRGTPEKLDEGLKELLLSVPGFRAMEEVASESFKSAVEETRRHYNGGMSEGDLMDEVKHTKLGRFLEERLRSSADEVLVDFAELLADQLDSLGHANVDQCFDYAVHGATEAIYDDLPYELTDREDELLKEVMRSFDLRRPESLPHPEAGYRTVYAKVAAEHGVASVELLRAPATVTASDKRRYCRLAASMMREVSKLPPPDAAEVMHDVLSKMYSY